MTDPRISIQKTIVHEGGFVDNPEDKGGVTNMGIEQKEWPNGDIRNLTIAQAIEWYSERYVKPWMTEINSQDVLDKIFDMGVLLGIQTAVRLLQRALGFALAEQDGDFGPATLAATNEHQDILLPAYKDVLSRHFRWIVQQDSTQQEFLDGWLKRVNS